MQVKILQWNVWFKENIEHVLGFMQEQEADIFCLQELTRGYVDQSHENTWEYLAHELGLNYRFQEIPVTSGDLQWSQANAILSRFQLRDKVLAWLHEPTSESDPNDQYRGYLEVEAMVGETPLSVANTHLSFHPDESDDELRSLLAIVAQRKQRYLLAGDFNVTPDSPRITSINSYLAHAGPSFDQPTWPTKPYKYPDITASTPQRRFDYVFTSADIKVVDARLLETDVSDHLPILITLEID